MKRFTLIAVLCIAGLAVTASEAQAWGCRGVSRVVVRQGFGRQVVRVRSAAVVSPVVVSPFVSSAVVSPVFVPRSRVFVQAPGVQVQVGGGCNAFFCR